jgi:hypothetical protein
MSRIYQTRKPVKKVYRQLISEFGLKDYQVDIQHDDGGVVINIHIPNHYEASALRNLISPHYEDYRITVTYDTTTNPVYAPDDEEIEDDGGFY